MPEKLSEKWMMGEIPRPSGSFPPANGDFPEGLRFPKFAPLIKEIGSLLERPRYSSSEDRRFRLEIPPEGRWPTFQTASERPCEERKTDLRRNRPVSAGMGLVDGLLVLMLAFDTWNFV
jgi:hypothetical protein